MPTHEPVLSEDILRRCAEAARSQTPARPETSAHPETSARPQTPARPAGSVVVLGGVAPDDAPYSLGIDMLVAGGKTNTLTQFADLARQAGLRIVAAAPQPSGHFVVECRPTI